MNAFLKCTVATLFGLIVFLALSACHPTPPPPLIGGPIHGYVAAEIIGGGVNATTAAGRIRLINAPDVEVWAQSTTTSVASAKVKTNAAGYFHTPVVPHGQYHMCTQGSGYLTHCESQIITVASTEVLLDHTILVAPTPRAVVGTVWFQDKKTACFWFRPAFNVNAVTQAKVSLVDGGGNVVAGPVNGNSLGEYILPVPVSPGSYKLTAACSGSSGESGVALTTTSQNVDVLVANHPPRIDALDLTKGTNGVRRADPGDLLRAKVTAVDPDGDTLHYQWTDDSGRSLGLPDSATVEWPLLATPSLNKLHVQVSDGKGGFAVSSRNLFGGPNEILFAGSVFDRFSGSPVDHAQVILNQAPVQTDARGEFAVKVPDAPRFVLNVSKIGYALSSRVYYGRNTGMKIPLDPSTAQTVNAGSGGTLEFPCERKREGNGNCQKGIVLKLGAGALVDKNGHPFAGTATMEAFQYDTSLPNPIPGDQGGTFGGKTVRLSTYGAFYLQPHDGAGNPLQMAPGKKVDVSMPIEGPLLGGAPGNIPFFRYDEDTGMWKELGKLTRAGDRYVGQVDHFSAFNADTQFAGSACLKVILDPASFTLPVRLDASYVDTAAGTFHHNDSAVTDNPIGIERMPPNQNFTLEVHDNSTNALLKSVTLLSGPELDPTKYPDGLVTDPNFNDCNGPVTVYNSNLLPTGPTYLMPITGGSIQDNSVAYRTATNADPGGNRDTFDHWKAVNNFPSGESTAIYFNNGDLKFGRNMHCRVAAGSVIACYVSNYGVVGTDDEATALSDARDPTKSPVATVAMEYDPAAPTGLNVQFWAYKSDGSYLAAAALDGQGAKPLPDICMACHNGFFDGTTHKASGASFLPFDVASFHYDTQGDPHAGSPNAAAVQEQFRQLNNMVLDTAPAGSDTHAGYQQLMNLWYPGGVGNPGQVFSFTQGAAQLSGTPFPGHEPLYDNVVAPVCRTCHITHSSSDNWTSFGQMQGFAPVIKDYACGPSSPAVQSTTNFAMPHAEVPFKRFWNDSLSSTLDNQLSLSGCPNH